MHYHRLVGPRLPYIIINAHYYFCISLDAAIMNDRKRIKESDARRKHGTISNVVSPLQKNKMVDFLYVAISASILRQAFWISSCKRSVFSAAWKSVSLATKVSRKKNTNLNCLTIFHYCFPFISASISMVNKRGSFLWIFLEHAWDQFHGGWQYCEVLWPAF